MIPNAKAAGIAGLTGKLDITDRQILDAVRAAAGNRRKAAASLDIELAYLDWRIKVDEFLAADVKKIRAASKEARRP